MTNFVRSSRWRQAFFVACLPFILVSIFVESLHTGQTRYGSAPAPIAIATGQITPIVQAEGAEESCPACNWLRLGRRVETPIALVRTQEVVVAGTPPLTALWPESPVPHPALFRGPPRPVLS